MDFLETDIFAKAFRRLYKKYKTLDTDLENFKEVVAFYPQGSGSRHWNLLLCREPCFVYKTLLMCRAVKGRDFRLVYLYDQKNNHVILIEIYYKGEQNNENSELYTSILNDYIKNHYS